MDNAVVFYPERSRGMLIQAGAALVLVAGGMWGLSQTLQADIGPVFVLYLLVSLLAVGPVSLLLYRVYALRGAAYILNRDGIRLYWGLRVEVIPIDDVRWIRPASETGFSLPLPGLRWPGAVLGVRSLLNGEQIEFIADDASHIILIATTRRIFAISPRQPGEFLRTFQQFNELGSLTPLVAQSIYPSFLLARVWATKPARYLLVGGLALSLLLLIWVSLVIPSRPAITLGFKPDGSPGEPVSSVQLLLLPLLNGFFFLADLAFGLIFFRREDREDGSVGKPLAYLLWGSGVLTALAFALAVYFMLHAG